MHGYPLTLVVDLYRQLPCWKPPPDWLIILTMDLAMFCDILSAVGPQFGSFHLENFVLHCNLPLQGFLSPPFTTPMYVLVMLI